MLGGGFFLFGFIAFYREVGESIFKSPYRQNSLKSFQVYKCGVCGGLEVGFFYFWWGDIGGGLGRVTGWLVGWVVGWLRCVFSSLLLSPMDI